MKRNIKLFSAVSPQKAKSLENIMDVSMRAKYPYKLFSPFTYSQDFRIPVPEQKEMFSYSVENIWQGLKIIEGSPDFSIFTEKPKKRKGKVQGHLFGSDLLEYIEARKKIFQPVYFHYLENYITNDLKEEVLGLGLEGGLAFHDIMKNVDIDNTETPLAHAYFTALYFNDYLNRRKEEVKKEIDDRFFKSESRHETLADPLARSLEYYSESSNTQRLLIKFFLKLEHRELDFYQRRYYSKLAEKIEQL